MTLTIPLVSGVKRRASNAAGQNQCMFLNPLVNTILLTPVIQYPLEVTTNSMQFLPDSEGPVHIWNSSWQCAPNYPRGCKTIWEQPTIAISRDRGWDWPMDWGMECSVHGHGWEMRKGFEEDAGQGGQGLWSGLAKYHLGCVSIKLISIDISFFYISFLYPSGAWVW